MQIHEYTIHENFKNCKALLCTQKNNLSYVVILLTIRLMSTILQCTAGLSIALLASQIWLFDQNFLAL